jgi:hypothetical protein
VPSQALGGVAEEMESTGNGERSLDRIDKAVVDEPILDLVCPSIRIRELGKPFRVGVCDR